MHKIVYLPIAKRDMTDIFRYISSDLTAPKAALDLMDALDQSISRLSQFPYLCKVYQTELPLNDEYRMLMVKNYAVFYVGVPPESCTS